MNTANRDMERFSAAQERMTREFLPLLGLFVVNYSAMIHELSSAVYGMDIECFGEAVAGRIDEATNTFYVDTDRGLDFAKKPDIEQVTDLKERSKKLHEMSEKDLARDVDEIADRLGSLQSQRHLLYRACYNYLDPWWKDPTSELLMYTYERTPTGNWRHEGGHYMGIAPNSRVETIDGSAVATAILRRPRDDQSSFVTVQSMQSSIDDIHTTLILVSNVWRELKGLEKIPQWKTQQ